MYQSGRYSALLFQEHNTNSKNLFLRGISSFLNRANDGWVVSSGCVGIHCMYAFHSRSSINWNFGVSRRQDTPSANMDATVGINLPF
ncbi:hypothetical protein L1887_16435 [Cichorium endivia]|nr:hypothetical protein L1887_22939 [Cichorium endivia]KAI3517222.1 hypothetical protein L1887_16435 [Cichorium endivia]